jgi:hypothetical protein
MGVYVCMHACACVCMYKCRYRLSTKQQSLIVHSRREHSINTQLLDSTNASPRAVPFVKMYAPEHLTSWGACPGADENLQSYRPTFASLSLLKQYRQRHSVEVSSGAGICTVGCGRGVRNCCRHCGSVCVRYSLHVALIWSISHRHTIASIPRIRTRGCIYVGDQRSVLASRVRAKRASPGYADELQR